MISGVSSNNLYSAQQAQQTALARLGSAQRINSAKDDAAGAAIASSFTVQLRGTEQVNRNIYDGLSLSNTASGGLSAVSDNLQRARELTVQAGNGINSASDSQALQGELNQVLQSINQVSGSTQFNGQNLLDSGFSASLQVGANPGDSQLVSAGGASTAALGLNGLDVSNQSNVNSVLQSLDAALSSVNSQQAELGAVSSGLESTLAANTSQNVASAASRSRIADSDYARESSNLTRANLSERAALQALSLYNANQPNPLNFVK